MFHFYFFLVPAFEQFVLPQVLKFKYIFIISSGFSPENSEPQVTFISKLNTDLPPSPPSENFYFTIYN